MNPTQHELVKQLLQEALQLGPMERLGWLGRQAIDPAVRAEVERLLGAAGGTMATAPIAAGTGANKGEFRRPERIGPYRVVSELGRGGMGAVLSAIRDDDNLKKRVAIKLVKVGMDTEALLKRFQLERQLLASLNHPNIAKVLDAGITDAASGEPGRPYFVMEYVEGTPLDEFCDNNELNTTERLRLFQKVCAAVHAAHQALIVHRDLKPGNILVTPDGEPKLLDFGIAKLLNADLMGVPLATLPEQRLMTPEYASPEQVRGQPITTQSDIYSLGVLLYQILTGRLPYNISSRVQAEIERVVCEVEPEAPSTAVTHAGAVTTKSGETVTRTPEELAKVRESVPTRLKRRLSGDLDKIVLMAMRKAPNRRYGSAEDFAADIGNHLADLPVKARPETWVYSASRFARRNAVGVGAAAVVMAAVLTATGVSTMMWRGEKAAREVALKAGEAEKAARVAAESATKTAEEQRRKAEAIDSASATLVTSFLKTTPDIVKLPGSLEVAKQVAAAGKAYTETIAKLQSEDPTLASRLFETNLLMGDLSSGTAGPGDGLLAQGIAHYEKALSIARSDAVLMQKASFGTACRNLALAYIRVGKGKLADSVLAEGENVARGLVHASSGRPLEKASIDARRVLMALLAVQGDRLVSMGNISAGKGKHLESLNLRETMAEESRLSTDADVRNRSKYDLPLGYKKIAKVELAAGNLPDAKKWFEKALELRRQAIGEKVDEARRRAVMVSLTDLAGVQLELNEVTSAAALCSEAKAFAMEIAADNSASFRSRQETVNVQILESRILLSQNAHADALKVLQNAIPAATRLRDQSPSDVVAIQTVAEGHTLLGNVLNTMNRSAEAATEWTTATQTWRDLMLQDPSQVEAVRGFAGVNRSIIRLFAASDPPRAETTRAAAVKSLEEAQAMLAEPSVAISQEIAQLRK